jgi:predicted amidohydrolase
MDAVTTVRAAAVQLSPVLYSRDGTVERVVAKINELATREVQFAVFPETVVLYCLLIDHTPSTCPQEISRIAGNSRY